jgi:hypothetical protein
VAWPIRFFATLKGQLRHMGLYTLTPTKTQTKKSRPVLDLKSNLKCYQAKKYIFFTNYANVPAFHNPKVLVIQKGTILKICHFKLAPVLMNIQTH